MFVNYDFNNTVHFSSVVQQIGFMAKNWKAVGSNPGKSKEVFFLCKNIPGELHVSVDTQTRTEQQTPLAIYQYNVFTHITTIHSQLLTQCAAIKYLSSFFSTRP